MDWRDEVEFAAIGFGKGFEGSTKNPNKKFRNTNTAAPET